MSAAPAVPTHRQGAELVKASHAYAKEDRARTWRLLGSSFVVFFAVMALAAFAPWPIAVVASVIVGLTTVRLFTFFHDWSHGAILADSTVGAWIMRIVGMYTLCPPSVWKQTHDYHHKNNAKLPGTTIGSFPMLTTDMWPSVKPDDRKAYAIARSPLVILFAYFTVFALGMCISAFRRAPKQHWQGPLALVMQVVTFGALAAALGPMRAVLVMALPLWIATTTGAYLFYAQHNFVGIDIRERKKWDYAHAATHSSSFFRMSPLMHWFTGNIGYHHVHHLNHFIPLYRLPEAMAGMPELQHPIETSWKPSDVLANLRLKLWDPKRGRMIGWDELEPVQPSQDGPVEAA